MQRLCFAFLVLVILTVPELAVGTEMPASSVGLKGMNCTPMLCGQKVAVKHPPPGSGSSEGGAWFKGLGHIESLPHLCVYQSMCPREGRFTSSAPCPLTPWLQYMCP